MGIYSTYVALNALTPVHLPDDIRQRVEGKKLFSFKMVTLFANFYTLLNAYTYLWLSSIGTVNECILVSLVVTLVDVYIAQSQLKVCVFVSVNICPEDGTVDRACFNEAQQFVYDLLEKR